MKTAIYTRVSTDKQETINQLIELRRFAASQDWEIVSEYQDVVSGKTSDRDEFQRLFQDAAKRRFDIVLFWALDRFSREGVLQTLQHLNRLSNYGIGFRSFSEPYLDSAGMFKEAIIAILAALARQERVRLSERTRAGLAVARARGKVLGRPAVAVDPAQVARLRSQGHSLRSIARQLGVSDGTIRARLATA